MACNKPIFLGIPDPGSLEEVRGLGTDPNTGNQNMTKGLTI